VGCCVSWSVNVILSVRIQFNSISEASTLEKIRGAADSVNDFDGRDAIFMNIFHMHRLVADEVFDWVGDGVSFCNCVVFPVSLV